MRNTAHTNALSKTGPPPELLSLQKRMTTLSWLQVVLGAVVLLLMGVL